jgi:hypothetical protein
MSVLKVYLKSGVAKIYFYAQAVVGAFLVSNTLRVFQFGENPVNEIIACGATGVLLCLGVAVPKKLQYSLRYLPGILLAFGGFMLRMATVASMSYGYQAINRPLIFLSFVLMAFGLSQFFFDGKQYASFTKHHIRYRIFPFTRGMVIAWEDVKNILYGDRSFEIVLKNGKSYKMIPRYGDSQNLRVHLDQMLMQGKNGISKPANDAKLEETNPLNGKRVAGA